MKEEVQAQQSKQISRRDMLKHAASYAILTGVTMHVLAPKAQAYESPDDPFEGDPEGADDATEWFWTEEQA